MSYSKFYHPKLLKRSCKINKQNQFLLSNIATQEHCDKKGNIATQEHCDKKGNIATQEHCDKKGNIATQEHCDKKGIIIYVMKRFISSISKIIIVNQHIVFSIQMNIQAYFATHLVSIYNVTKKLMIILYSVIMLLSFHFILFQKITW